ncbi:MAG: glycosyltransferase family A protein, partial [Verrucomicrobiota bacterium]
TYNRAELLRETLDSVFQQDETDFEIIVVDDGSVDETRDLLASYGDRLRFFQQDNQGPGSARNLGIQYASGRYVAFLDSDDLWFPWTLRTYANVLRKTNDPAFLVGCPERFTRRDELLRSDEAEICYNAFPDYYASGDQWRWWGVSSFVVRREALIDVGGYTSEKINGEDADLAMRLGVAPRFVQITQPVTFGYREHHGSAMSDFSRTLQGVKVKLKAEQNSQYPGGRARAAERRRILGRHLRSVTFDCLREGRHGDAWTLYGAMFKWHIASFRWKYLIGFPLRALFIRK